MGTKARRRKRCPYARRQLAAAGGGPRMCALPYPPSLPPSPLRGQRSPLLTSSIAPDPPITQPNHCVMARP